MRLSRLAQAVVFLALVSGCHKTRPPLKGFPLPTKDDVAFVNGKSFSISDYFAIRSWISKAGKAGNTAVSAKQDTIWVGTAALAIQDESLAHGRALSPKAALDTALYALGRLPPEAAQGSLKEVLGTELLPSAEDVKRRVNQALSRAVVRRNPQVLAELQ